MSTGLSWSPKEHKRLRALYPTTPTPELARILGRSPKTVAGRGKVRGIKKAVGWGGHGAWTPRHEKLLRALYPHTATGEVARRVGHSLLATYRWAKKLGLRKTLEYMNSPAACRLRRGDHVGRGFWFQKGHVPANKGLRRKGYAPGRMAETQFK